MDSLLHTRMLQHLSNTLQRLPAGPVEEDRMTARVLACSPLNLRPAVIFAAQDAWSALQCSPRAHRQRLKRCRSPPPSVSRDSMERTFSALSLTQHARMQRKPRAAHGPPLRPKPRLGQRLDGHGTPQPWRGRWAWRPEPLELAAAAVQHRRRRRRRCAGASNARRAP